jgi:carbon-monoxide dehydrogenase small subunit
MTALPKELLVVRVTITVNGQPQAREVEPRLLLAHFLRDICDLTGTHVGCETSICGACTVLLDGRAVKSCTVFAVQADGAQVTTVEGLAPPAAAGSLVADGPLSPIQQAFWDCHGLQCGYCTPGMMMTASQLIADGAAPSREAIAHGLKGNLCRCTGYTHIVDAIERAARASDPVGRSARR